MIILLTQLGLSVAMPLVIFDAAGDGADGGGYGERNADDESVWRKTLNEI